MKPSEFIQHIEDAKVLAAIAGAEEKSSGEIRLFITHQPVADPLAAARAQFVKLGMNRTRLRNGVLLFFAPRSQHFAILGDQGINEKCGEPFWQSIVDDMSPRLKRGEFTEAVVEAIHRVGAALAEHFPREPGDADELPNQIARE